MIIINNIKDKDHIDLAKMFGELGFKRGAEIGVREGNFSEKLCTHVKSLEKLYLVDPWDIVFEDPVSRYYGIERQERFYKKVQKRFGKNPICEIIKKTSMEAVRDIEPYSLDFVYIDGAHTYDYVMTDIIEWTRRIRKGGIVSGDDYKYLRFGNVIEAVDNYCKAHQINTLNIMQPKEEGNGIAPVWWFVKQ